MLKNDLDGIMIVKWQFPECCIVFKKNSKISKEEFKTKLEAVEFIRKNKLKITGWIGKGWIDRKDNASDSSDRRKSLNLTHPDDLQGIS